MGYHARARFQLPPRPGSPPRMARTCCGGRRTALCCWWQSSWLTGPTSAGFTPPGTKGGTPAQPRCGWWNAPWPGRGHGVPADQHDHRPGAGTRRGTWPPCTPSGGTGVPTQHWEQTGQRSHTTLARAVSSCDRPFAEIGKNRSASADRQAACCHQVPYATNSHPLLLQLASGSGEPEGGWLSRPSRHRAPCGRTTPRLTIYVVKRRRNRRSARPASPSI